MNNKVDRFYHSLVHNWVASSTPVLPRTITTAHLETGTLHRLPTAPFSHLPRPWRPHLHFCLYQSDGSKTAQNGIIQSLSFSDCLKFFWLSSSSVHAVARQNFLVLSSIIFHGCIQPTVLIHSPVVDTSVASSLNQQRIMLTRTQIYKLLFKTLLLLFLHIYREAFLIAWGTAIIINVFQRLHHFSFLLTLPKVPVLPHLHQYVLSFHFLLFEW